MQKLPPTYIIRLQFYFWPVGMAKFLITNDREEDTSSVQKSQWDDTQVSLQNDEKTSQSPATNQTSSVFADADFHTPEKQAEDAQPEISYDVPQVQDDTSRIDQTQELTDTEKSQSAEDTIPNIYIQNDTTQEERTVQEPKKANQDTAKQEVVTSKEETLESPKTKQSSEPITSNEEPTEDGGVDLDAFFDDTPKKEEKPTQEEGKSQSQSTETDAEVKDKLNVQSKSKTKAQVGSLQRHLIAAGMLVAWGLILFFLFKMMFPLGVNPNDGSTIPTSDNTVVFNTGSTDTGTQHSVASGDMAAEPIGPTQEEIREDYIFKLEAYAIQGEEYTNMWRTQRDNDILKYGLYIHKKSLDALDTLALPDDIDTSELQELFDTFDTYIDILEWSNNDSVPPTQEPESITQPTTQETDIQSTTTWSVQTGSQDAEFGF